MHPIEIKKGIFWVGAIDWNIRDFHGYSTEKGTTYNSYLAVDEHVTLFDGVKKPFVGELIHRIYNIMDPGKIDYLVINHVEPDHSSGVPDIMERVKPSKVFCSKMAYKTLKAHYHNVDRWPIEQVGTGDSVSIGNRNIRFVETRMLHWPDSMFSYIPEEKLLISSDAFGEHWATTERFDDEVAPEELMEKAGKYYANIILLYSPIVRKTLTNLADLGLEIDIIAPDHGIIWRSDPGKIIDAYDRWSRGVTKNKAVVVYDTMWQSTAFMAKAVGDSLADEGMSVKVMALEVNHRSEVIDEILEARVMVFGSSTLNNGMLPRMADLLHYLKGLKPFNKVAGCFGSYGWSGESVKLMNAELAEMRLNLVDGVRHKYVPGHDALKKCRSLGKRLAEAAKELEAETA